MTDKLHVWDSRSPVTSPTPEAAEIPVNCLIPVNAGFPSKATSLEWNSSLTKTQFYLSDSGSPVTNPTLEIPENCFIPVNGGFPVEDASKWHSNSLTKPEKEKELRSTAKRENGNITEKGTNGSGLKTEKGKPLRSASKTKNGNVSDRGVKDKGQEREKPSLATPSGNLPKIGTKITEKGKPLRSASKTKNGNVSDRGVKDKGQIGFHIAKLWCIPVILLIILRGSQGIEGNSSGVQIHVPSSVIVQPSDSKTVIPCSFTTDRNTTYNLQWECIDKDNELVVNTELGQVFNGKHYKDGVTAYTGGRNCTLALPSLQNYSCNYLLTVFAHEVGNSKAKVQVIIRPGPNTTLALSVQSQVNITLGVKNATLPCNYTLTEDLGEEDVKLVWTRNGITGSPVLERDSAGNVKVFEAVHLGNGCSLVLEAPSVNDSDIFTVTLFLHTNTLSSEDVEVTVFPGNKDVSASGVIIAVVVLMCAVLLVVLVAAVLRVGLYRKGIQDSRDFRQASTFNQTAG